MTTELLWATQARWWWLGIATGLALGVAMAVSMELALGAGLVLLALFALSRSRNRAELLVALYWVAFAVYSIVFYGVIVRFGFYPFYLAFLVTIAASLMRGGVRLDPVLAWLYLGYMITMLYSFLAFDQSVDSAVIQRLLPPIVGAMVLLQFRSREGLRPVTTAGVIAGLIIAAYVVYRSIESGFGYRGSLEANPNAAARMVGLGAVIAIGWLVHRMGTPGGRWRIVATVAALGVMVYATLLLASRGMTFALIAALAFMVLRAMATDVRKIGIVLLFAVLGAGGLLLPGGSNLVERFTSPDEEVTSAGSRIPIWEATIEQLTASSAYELALGHGFASSEEVVERRFAGQPSTHNTYLQIAYEFGIVSLVLFVGLLAYVFWRSWQVPGGHGLIMLGLTTFFIIDNMTGNVANSFPFWIAMGYVGAIGTWAEP